MNKYMRTVLRKLFDADVSFEMACEELYIVSKPMIAEASALWERWERER